MASPQAPCLVLASTPSLASVQRREACHRQLHPVNQKIALSTSSTYKCSLTPGFLQPPSFLRQQMLLIWCCWSLQAIFYPGIMEVQPHDFHTLKITWPLFLNSRTMHTYEGLWIPMDLSESSKTCRKPSLTSFWRTRYHGISRCHDAPWSQTCTSVGGAGIPAGQRSKVAAGAWDAVSPKSLGSLKPFPAEMEETTIMIFIYSYDSIHIHSSSEILFPFGFWIGPLYVMWFFRVI